MQFLIQSSVRLDGYERRLIREALSPFRVLTEHGLDFAASPHSTTNEDFTKTLARIQNGMTIMHLKQAHDCLLDLGIALTNDSLHWDREASIAPVEAPKGSLILKPREACRILAETRRHQAAMCERALEVVRNGMRALKPLHEAARNLVRRAETLLDTP